MRTKRSLRLTLFGKTFAVVIDNRPRSRVGAITAGRADRPHEFAGHRHEGPRALPGAPARAGSRAVRRGRGRGDSAARNGLGSAGGEGRAATPNRWPVNLALANSEGTLTWWYVDPVRGRAPRLEVPMTLDDTVGEFQTAADAFAKGNPEPVKSLFSHADDVTLANPFGPAVRGWEKVSGALDMRHQGSATVRSATSRTWPATKHRAS